MALPRRAETEAEAVEEYCSLVEAEAEVETKRKSLMKTSALSFDQAASSQQVHDSEADGRVVWLCPVGPKLKQKQ